MRLINKYTHLASDGEHIINIMRPNPLCNPFTRGGRYSRQDVVNLHKKWIYRRVIEDKDTTILDALLEITSESLLMCCCTPKPCHGNTLIALLEMPEVQAILKERKDNR